MTALFGILPAFLVHYIQNLRFLSRRRFPSAYAHWPQQDTAFREPGFQIVSLSQIHGVPYLAGQRNLPGPPDPHEIQSAFPG